MAMIFFLHAIFCIAQISQDGARLMNKIGESCIACADETPDDAKQDERQCRVACQEMPLHCIAADFFRYDGGGDERCQSPMKKPHRQIPHAKFLHVASSFLVFAGCVVKKKPAWLLVFCFLSFFFC